MTILVCPLSQKFSSPYVTQPMVNSGQGCPESLFRERQAVNGQNTFTHTHTFGGFEFSLQLPVLGYKHTQLSTYMHTSVYCTKHTHTFTKAIKGPNLLSTSGMIDKTFTTTCRLFSHTDCMCLCVCVHTRICVHLFQV